MADDNTFQEMSEQEIAERDELFRYTDLSHPLMKVLYDFKLTSPIEAE